jgi:hypothetical protein
MSIMVVGCGFSALLPAGKRFNCKQHLIKIVAILSAIVNPFPWLYTGKSFVVAISGPEEFLAIDFFRRIRL